MEDNKQDTIYVEEAGQKIINSVERSETGLPKVTTTVAEDIGRISDPAVAKELADIERTQGRDASLAREKELQKQAESPTSSNEQQREFEKVMDMLTIKEGREINKNAFIDMTDGRGRRYRVLHLINPRTTEPEQKRGYPGEMIFFCRNGVFKVNMDNVEKFLSGTRDFDDVLGRVNWTLLGDMIESPGKIPEDPNNYPTFINIDTGNNGEQSMNTAITKFDFRFPEVKAALASAIQLSEKMGVSKKERKASEVIRASDLIDGLV